MDVFAGGEGAGGLGEFGGSEFLERGLVGAAKMGIGGAGGLGALSSGGGAMLAAGKG